MKICFLEIEPVETAYFARKLAAHELLFVDSLVEVPFDVDIVSVFIGSPIGEAFLEAHPRLKFIATRSTTLDHLDLDACTRRGVAIGRVESYGDHIVAEHTFALLLAVTKRLREAMEVPRQSRFSYEGLRGVELRGKSSERVHRLNGCQHRRRRLADRRVRIAEHADRKGTSRRRVSQPTHRRDGLPADGRMRVA